MRCLLKPLKVSKYILPKYNRSYLPFDLISRARFWKSFIIFTDRDTPPSIVFNVPSTLKTSPFPKTRPSSGSVKVEVLIGSKPKSDVEDKIDKGKNPPGGLRAKGLRKLKEKVTGKSKGGMAKRKAKKWD